MASNNQVARIASQVIPSPEEAIKLFEEAGGSLTHFSVFGADPLGDDVIRKQQREVQFHQGYPSFDPIFYNLVNGDDTLFRQGLLLYIQLTHSLC